MEFKIEIKNMERHPVTGFVTTVRFLTTVTDGDKSISYPGASVFYFREHDVIPFEELTKEIVLEWVVKDVNFAFLESELKNQINYSLINGVPWKD
jgi:hypothetical protein